MQWGRNGHWPLLNTYGTKRYRSVGCSSSALTLPKPKQKQKRKRRACCAGGRRTTAGTGHRRCFRQRRRAAISSSESAGSPPVESGQLGRPHDVSRGLMQHMQLMLTTATPRKKTKTHPCVSSNCQDVDVSNGLLTLFTTIYFQPSKTSLMPIALHNCPGADPRVCPRPDVA